MVQLLTRSVQMAALTLAVFPVAFAAEGEGKDEEQKQVPPSFKPGAQVTLAVTVQAPERWLLNYLVPLRLQFDEEYLEKAPFTVEQAVWDFSFDKYIESYTAKVPLLLSPELPDGVLVVPLVVMCSICDEGGESCTFSNEDLAVPLVVRAEAGADEKNQALNKGELPFAHLLGAP